MAEEWQSVPGFPRYDVSTMGRVRSHVWGRTHPIKPRQVRGGYHAVCLRESNQDYYLRLGRLALTTFRGRCPDGHEAAHLNGDKTDDRLANLAWVTHQENIDHKRLHGTERVGERHPGAKLDVASVLEMRRLLNEVGVPSLVIAKRFGISYAQTRRIAKGERWAVQGERK